MFFHASSSDTNVGISSSASGESSLLLFSSCSGAGTRCSSLDSTRAGISRFDFVGLLQIMLMLVSSNDFLGLMEEPRNCDDELAVR